MLTRCPGCETHFRVTAEQLKARSGRVRCGECQNVFNALDSLIEESVVVTAPFPSESAQQDLAAAPADAEAETAAFSEVEAGQVAVPPALCVPSGTSEPTEEALEEIFRSQADTHEPSFQEPTEVIELEATEAEPVEAEVANWSGTFPEPRPPPRRWPWVIGSFIALAAMGVQAVLAFRVELAVLMPEARPVLVALCDIADCEVSLPTKVGLVGIEASDLHPDSEHAGRLALTATLKNRAPFAQQFPHLELTLTDTADQTIARKVLAPADYLPPKTVFANGMTPNADIVATIGIDPGEMAASGYRLYLFYP